MTKKKYNPGTTEKINALFQDVSNINSFHDAVFEVNNISYTDGELREIFKLLPENIQEIAFEWTLSDTVFRDKAYSFLKTSGITYSRRNREHLVSHL